MSGIFAIVDFKHREFSHDAAATGEKIPPCYGSRIQYTAVDDLVWHAADAGCAYQNQLEYANSPFISVQVYIILPIAKPSGGLLLTDRNR